VKATNAHGRSSRDISRLIVDEDDLVGGEVETFERERISTRIRLENSVCVGD
jgi:hypothetical protein